MLTGWSAIAAILVMAVVTFALRALPFVAGGPRPPPPPPPPPFPHRPSPLLRTRQYDRRMSRVLPSMVKSVSVEFVSRFRPVHATQRMSKIDVSYRR